MHVPDMLHTEFREHFFRFTRTAGHEIEMTWIIIGLKCRMIDAGEYPLNMFERAENEGRLDFKRHPQPFIRTHLRDFTVAGRAVIDGLIEALFTQFAAGPGAHEIAAQRLGEFDLIAKRSHPSPAFIRGWCEGATFGSHLYCINLEMISIV